MERNYTIEEREVVTKNIFNEDDEKALNHLIHKMLGFNDNVELDDNLKETPHRVCKLWTEMTEGYRIDPASYLDKVFPINSPNMADNYEDTQTKFNDNETGSIYKNGIVVVSTDAWSNCVHHLAPMHCRVDVAYIPKEKVVGLSKIIRMVKMYGRRLNLQEGWQANIANAMMNKLDALGVAVRISGIHSCCAMRGVAEQTSKTTTSCVRGVFATKPEARAEAFKLMDENKI
jgi:GTP cyclohydrolase I